MSRIHDRSVELERRVLAGLEAFRASWFTFRMLESNLDFPGRCRLRACVARLLRTGRIRTQLHPSGEPLYAAHPLPKNTWSDTKTQRFQKTITWIQSQQRATAHDHLQRTSDQVAAWLDRIYPDPPSRKDLQA